MRRWAAITGSIAAGAAMLAVVAAAPAHAAAYRYWTYWQANAGDWQFATAGPAFTLPEDGAVEGWRFAVTSQEGTANAAPRSIPDFEVICGATAPSAGTKRVALVVDSGLASDAPDGETAPAAITRCVVVADNATGYDVVRSVAQVRTDNGLVCGIAGYPRSECAPVVDVADRAGSESPQPSATPIVTHASTAASAPAVTGTPTSSGPWVTALIAVVALAIGAWLWKRRRHD